MRKGSVGAVASVAGFMVIAFALLTTAYVAADEGDDAAPRKAAKAQKRPPGWGDWSAQEKREWRQSLERSRKAVRKHAREREDAAIRALETAAAEGAPVGDAEQMARTGLDEGLAPADFEPLGRSVSAWTKEGLKGQELADRVHQEVNRRREARRQAREQRKQQRRTGKPGGQPSGRGRPSAGRGADADEQEGEGRRGRGEADRPRGGPGGQTQGEGRGRGRGRR